MSAGFDAFWGRVETKLDASRARRRRRALVAAGSSVAVVAVVVVAVGGPGPSTLEEQGFSARGAVPASQGAFAARFFVEAPGGEAREVRADETVVPASDAAVVVAVSSTSSSPAFASVVEAGAGTFRFVGASERVAPGARDVVLGLSLRPSTDAVSVVVLFTPDEPDEARRRELGAAFARGRVPEGLLGQSSRPIARSP